MYAADKACVLTREGPTDTFACSIGVKQGCPASPLLFGLYLDELEELLENAADRIDCPNLASTLLAILLFADDIALFSYSPSGLQEQLDILAKFCKERGLTVNVKKTKTMIFEHANCKSSQPPFLYDAAPIERVAEFKYLGALMHSHKGLTPATEYLHKAARRAMFGLYRRCQQMHINDPSLKLKLFDILVKPILNYCCEIWSVLGSKSALDNLERIEFGFLKVLLGVHVRTKTLHVLAEFGRYPLRLTWMAQSAKYLRRLEVMTPDRMLKQAFLADCRLPGHLSWYSHLSTQLRPFLTSAPTSEHHTLQGFSLHMAQIAHAGQLQTDDSSRTLVYRDLKTGYQQEGYIQQCNNKHLRRVLAQFRTGSHWLNIETGRYTKVPQEERFCSICQRTVRPPGVKYFDAFDSDSDEERPDPVEDEHHAIFSCSGYVSARRAFDDLFPEDVVSVGQFLAQPDCNRIAKFLTEIRFLRANSA